MRFVHCQALPVKRLNGDTVHALRAENQPELLMCSPEAYMTFQKYKKCPDTMTEDDYRFLQLCLNQSEELRR